MRAEKPFCKQAVLRELHQVGVYMKVVSNNHNFSMQWMRGRHRATLGHRLVFVHVVGASYGQGYPADQDVRGA